MKKGRFLGPTPGALEKEGTGSCPGIRTSNKVPRRFCCDECFFFFFNFLFIDLFLVALGLHCCVKLVSSCGKWGLLSGCGLRASHCSGSSCHGTWAPDTWAQYL